MYGLSGINGLINCRWKWSPDPLRPQTRSLPGSLTSASSRYFPIIHLSHELSVCRTSSHHVGSICWRQNRHLNDENINAENFKCTSQPSQASQPRQPSTQAAQTGQHYWLTDNFKKPSQAVLSFPFRSRNWRSDLQFFISCAKNEEHVTASGSSPAQPSPQKGTQRRARSICILSWKTLLFVCFLRGSIP